MVDEQRIQQAQPAELPEIFGELGRLLAITLSRIVNVPSLVSTQSEPEPVLLDAAQASKLVNLTPLALRRSARFRPARRELGPRTIRFERDALLRIARRAA